MSNFAHRIRKLHCLVSTRSQTEAFAIRQSLHDRWQDTLLPAFESTFDQIAGSDRTIHIPKLEFHLKVNSEQELLDLLPELIRQQLQEQLRSQDLTTISQSGAVWRETTAQQNQFEILMHYLRTGSLPWQVSYAQASDIAVDLKETCRQLRSQLINYLSDRAETTAFYFRLLQLLTRSQALAIIDPLLDRLSAEWKIPIIAVIEFVSESTQIQLDQTMRSQLVAAILSSISSEQIPSHEFSRSLARILTQAGIDRQVLVDTLPSVAAALLQIQSNFERSLPDPNLLVIENPELNLLADEVLRSQLSNQFKLDSLNLLEEADIRNQDHEFETGFSNDPENPVVDFAEQNDGFSLFVNYAGLVLIHPFISPLFEATGIKEPNSPAIADTQIPRAAALLHFLATGHEEIYEYELGLIKILLGLEPETPLLVGEGLLQNCDREEAETLLQSAISYWTILGNISIDGLRASFLQRSGLLRKTEDCWNLNVEHQSFDMLLEHLPWTISIVKLSWMKYPLYTEWMTF
jgi:Contractile injection system tape measure protein